MLQNEQLFGDENIFKSARLGLGVRAPMHALKGRQGRWFCHCSLGRWGGQRKLAWKIFRAIPPGVEKSGENRVECSNNFGITLQSWCTLTSLLLLLLRFQKIRPSIVSAFRDYSAPAIFWLHKPSGIARALPSTGLQPKRRHGSVCGHMLTADMCSTCSFFEKKTLS